MNGFRGTAKAHRVNGTNLNAPFIYGGDSVKGPVTDLSDYRGICGKRFERIETSARGSYAIDANNHREWLGGVATRYWILPIVEEPHASEVEAEGDDLEAMTVPQLMEIAKSIKLPGRGTARKPQLIEGIRAHRAA